MDDTHFTIRIPKFSGYKTLFVNTAVLMLGVVAALYPAFRDRAAPIDPATLGLFYDGLTGGLVAIIGAINIALRLMTVASVPFKQKTSDAGSPDALERFEASRLGLASTLAEPVVRTEYLQGVPAGLLVADAVELDHVAHCTFPHCACHQRCRTQSIGAASAVPEPVVQLTPEERRRDRSVRQYLAAFLVPFLLPSMLLSVVALSGCAAVQTANAVVAAETLEQRAYALYGTFVALEEAAVPLVRDKSIPKAVRKAIQRADARAKPLADRLRSLAVQLTAARHAYLTSDGDGGKVLALTQSIGAVMAELEPAIREMQAGVAKAKQP